MTSGLSGVLPSRDLKSLKSDDDGLCDGRVNQGVGVGGILPPKKSALCDTLGTPWGNRVVGLTDELHFARGINAPTLKEDPNGVYVTPSHVHKAIQQYMGFDLFAKDLGHGLDDVEPLPIFDPFKATFG